MKPLTPDFKISHKERSITNSHSKTTERDVSTINGKQHKTTKSNCNIRNDSRKLRNQRELKTSEASQNNIENTTDKAIPEKEITMGDYMDIAPTTSTITE